MDNVLIEVAIGLVLIYASLSLLVMKVQEIWHGTFLRGRVQNLHRLVHEAVAQDDDLQQRLYANPLLFALSDGDQAQPGSMMRLKVTRGPSAIPPDLFARALLMELNPKGRHASEDFASPDRFLDQIDQATGANSRRAKLIRGLRGLVVGNERNWGGFEAAIARWFTDIGNRSEGWYKRRAGQVGLTLALLMCVLLNVDTVHISNTLGADPELRAGLGRIADRVVEQKDSAAPVGGAVTVVVDPETRTVARLIDAIAALREAFRRDKAVAGYGHYVSDAETLCKDVKDATGVPKAVPDKAWEEGKYLSNADTWQTMLPALLPYIEQTIQKTQTDLGAGSPHRLRAAYNCMSHVSAWVRAASTASAAADTRRLMLDAAQALEDSKSGLLALIRHSETRGSLRLLFQTDPSAYNRCARLGPTSMDQFDTCVRRELQIMDRLPLGHSSANRRRQFCTVVEPAPTSGGASQWAASWCGGAAAVPLPTLGAGTMVLQFEPWSLLPWLAGVLLSTIFVSLGAPFWFDLLSKLVRVRNAGAVREAQQGALKGIGTLPLPPAATPSAVAPSAPRPQGGPGDPATLPAVEGAGNTFEDQLLPREVIALQIALNVQPASGKLDETTREAIRRECRDRGLGDTDRLSLATYTRLVGRPPVQARDVIGPVLGSRPRLRSPWALASALGQNLNHKLAFPQRIPLTEDRFSDDLRALAVLYRYKADNTTPLRQRKVVTAAVQHPEQLDELDEAQIQTLLAPATAVFPRDPVSPWMDWALGELGQVELNGSSQATSNPRVCSYLQACGRGLAPQGDSTPWCGMFVAWVLEQHNNLVQPAQTLAIPVAPEGAKNWRGWSRTGPMPATPPATPPLPPAAGDVVVVNVPGGGHHVGFVLEVAASQSEFWMLGGNQTRGTRVSVSRWTFADLA
ncbi:MAG: CHAP domain-containing protein [Rubrivivax sp.]|nr:CHAP domain-containing protein [Rubrivivax sp.]